MTIVELWERLHDATPSRWAVGQPAFEPHRAVPRSQYAFDSNERPKVGHRTREWTATGETEGACLEEMARCLAEMKEGKVPR